MKVKGKNQDEDFIRSGRCDSGIERILGRVLH